MEDEEKERNQVSLVQKGTYNGGKICYMMRHMTMIGKKLQIISNVI